MTPQQLMPSFTEIAEVLAYNPDTGKLTWKVARPGGVKPGDVAGCKTGAGYLTVGYANRHFYAHRVAFLLAYGRWPTNHLDHINGRRDDNRAVNLREATQKQNALNRGANTNSTSRAVGVCWNKKANKWLAQSCDKYLGHFVTESEAIDAVIAYRKQHQPEYSGRIIESLEQIKATINQ
jgi:hypothetical protein